MEDSAPNAAMTPSAAMLYCEAGEACAAAGPTATHGPQPHSELDSIETKATTSHRC